MRSRLTLSHLAALTLGLALLAAACGGEGGLPPNIAEDGGPENGGADEGEPTEVPIPEPSPFPGISSDLVVRNAEAPTAMAFAPDGRLFYAERDTGVVRIVSPNGQLAPQPFVELEVATGDGWGLVGLALDPDFLTNRFVYLYYTEPTGERTAKPVIVRYTETGGRGVNRTVLVDDLPEATLFGEYAVGGALRFGPDGFLYIAIGDHINADLAQDLSSVRGKILRLNPSDGSAAPDNPFATNLQADPRVFAYGFLEVGDLAFDPDSGALYATENGTFFCCDELNLVEAGENYGWPQIGPEQEGAPPVHFYTLVDDVTKVRPTGIEFVSGDAYPSLGDALLTCEEVSGFMRRLTLSPTGNRVTSDDVIVSDCTLDIAVAPDGSIYYSNENEIRRLVETGG